MSKEQIKKILSGQRDVLKNNYHVKELGLFGSVVRGENTKDSDVDILVEFETPVGFFEFIRLENFLAKVIGNKVDLVSKKALKRAIREEVLKHVMYV